jgi:hypothetical protein
METRAHTALNALGEILEARGEHFAIVVVGGSALNLLGIVDRVTRDVDVIAFGNPPDSDNPTLQEPSEHLPSGLAAAAALVARDFGLDADWLNTGPALQWKQGLPQGMEARVRWRSYGNLNVGIVDRRDLVLFKLYAAADSTGPESVHYQDIIALGPSANELNSARDWIKTQDASRDFHEVLDQVIEHVYKDTRQISG